jgi:hypothetical protein
LFLPSLSSSLYSFLHLSRYHGTRVCSSLSLLSRHLPARLCAAGASFDLSRSVFHLAKISRDVLKMHLSFRADDAHCRDLSPARYAALTYSALNTPVRSFVPAAISRIFTTNITSSRSSATRNVIYVRTTLYDFATRHPIIVEHISAKTFVGIWLRSGS